jgi:hypothetical protein
MHAAGVEISSRTGNVCFTIDEKLTHVPAAFEPPLSEKRVERFERGIGAHFEVHPVRWIAFHNEVQQFCLTGLSLIRGLDDSLPLLTCPQVPGHYGFAKGCLTKAARAF